MVSPFIEGFPVQPAEPENPVLPVETEKAAQPAAKIISVFSLRGGAGTTSVAVNLSIALAQLWSIEVSLWDLAISGGHCAFFLNLKPQAALASLSGWQAAAIEDNVIASMLNKHATGIRLLPSVLTAMEAELVTSRLVGLTLPYLLENSTYLVIDAGNHFTEPALDLFDQSDIILLLFSPELASVKSAMDAIQIFEKLNLASRVLPVANQTFPSNPLPLPKIAQALKRDITAEIPYDSLAFTTAINTGKPFITFDPQPPASLAVAKLAYKLSATEMESRKPGFSTPLLELVRSPVKSE
jgi:pilus assembly protein CpaE